MKIFKLLAVAFVAMLSFSSCDQHECEDFGYDHSADLAGTWTCLQENFAEALVISADGKVVSTGVAFGEYWENVEGKIEIKNGKATMTFEDGDDFEGHFDIIPGMAFSIYNDEGRRFTYNYCANDLADEIVGMWVCNDGPMEGNDMSIHTFNEDGTVLLTGLTPDGNGFIVNQGGNTYKVIGDLLFNVMSGAPDGNGIYACMRVNIASNGTSLGDIMTTQGYLPVNGTIALTPQSYLRIKQSLDLEGNKYDYIKTFVTNVKGEDKDIEFMGYTFNFAEMDGVKLDKMLKTILFAVEFTAEDTIRYSCHYNNQPMYLDAPIAVEGNKMTVKMSEKNPVYRDIDLYTFQDADCSQMHMYMPTYAFINFFGNMQLTIMEQLDQIDLADETAVEGIFNNIDDVVETINVSFVMGKSSTTKAL